MSESEPRVTWICNTCGTQEVLPREDQPVGWERVYMVMPPRGAPDDPDYQEVKMDLCAGCSGFVQDMLERGDLPYGHKLPAGSHVLAG